MWNFILLSFAILFSYGLGFLSGYEFLRSKVTKLLTEVEDGLEAFLARFAEDESKSVDFDPYTTFHKQLQIECPEGHAGVGELCDQPGVWICVERFKELEVQNWIDEDQEGDVYEYGPTEPGYFDHYIGINHDLPRDLLAGDQWVEVDIHNGCGHGCKIYRNERTGYRILAHSSSYGCKVTT